MIFGIKQFHQYLYVQMFKFFTDHKPLSGLRQTKLYQLKLLEHLRDSFNSLDMNFKTIVLLK